jgi:hypothetical protein
MEKKIQVTINGKDYDLDLKEIEELYAAIKSAPGDSAEEKLTEAFMTHPDMAPSVPYPVEPIGPGEE